jgi:hypothetical protein
MVLQQPSLPGFFVRRDHTINTDTQWHGDVFSHDKDAPSTRLLVQNIRGLHLNGPKGMDMALYNQATLTIDIFALSEHCLDTSKFQIKQSLQTTLQREFPGKATMQVDSSANPSINNYKPGGTGLIALGDVVGRLEPKGKGGDPLGRWSYLIFRRKNLPPLIIYSVYQVCQTPTNKLGNTAYHQQRRALDQEGRSSVHPRQAFINDLISSVQFKQQQQYDVMICGDFNEDLEARRSGILRLATTLQLVDPWLQKFPHHVSFGTHDQGTRRIDAILLSPRLIPSIQRIGYAPFQYVTDSDHRALFVDFHTVKLFGDSVDLMPPVSFRGVKTNDKRAVTKFCETMHQHLTHHDAFSILDAQDPTPAQIEAIDKLVGQAGDSADTACKARRPEFYSRILIQQRSTISILRSHLSSLKQKVDRSTAIHARMNRQNLNFQLPTSIEETVTALHKADTDLRSTRKSHADRRSQELIARAEDADSSRQHQQAKNIRKINKSEAGRRTYRILDAMRRQNGANQRLDRLEIPLSWPSLDSPIASVTTLEDPKTCNSWRLITEPSEIEYYLLLRNRLHFGQAQGTPFTEPPISNDVDWSANSTSSTDILNGTYQSQVDVPQCQALLAACRAATDLDLLPAELELKDFTGKIKVWKESTTTSPSGRHLGRYKALLSTGNYDPESEEFISFVDQQSAILKLLLFLVNYCLRTGHVLERWKTIVNVMIFKDDGVYRIHRLRVIHIYEADFNLLLAVKWRQLLHSADNAGLINDGQFGGRPGCEAQSLTLLEELKNDLSYMTRRTLFNFDNDASSCYDRIIVSLASLINRKYGIHRRVVLVHATTLENARYRLRTAIGVSETEYSHHIQFPIHGSGQGSGNSPFIWLFISATLFDVHNRASNGALFMSPDGTSTVRITMVGFVDDSTGSCNDFQPQTQASISELSHRMQSDAQTWNDLLFCSGGKLELPKCSFHVLHFDFKANGTPVAAVDPLHDHITIRDSSTGAMIPIQAKRPFEPHKTLGHFKSPAGNQQAQLQAITQKAKRIATLISTSPVNRYGALLAYHTVYVPSVKYPLPQSFFTKQRLEKAQASTMGPILAKCGFGRTTPRALIYAPTELGGGGFIPWYVLQGEGQVTNFLKHWRTDSLISRTLKVTLAWAQFQAGISTPILVNTSIKLPHLECRWVNSLRDFLAWSNSVIQVTKPSIPLLERIGDFHIMDQAIKLGIFQAVDLKILNYCRLYLHVTTVSELFDADGLYILPHIFQCRREPWFSPKTVITLQRRPSEYQIRYKWQRLLRHWMKDDGSIANSIYLGRWLSLPDTLRRQRSTYYRNSFPPTLHHWYQGAYWEYRKHACDPSIFIRIQPTPEVHQFDSVPVTVEILDDHRLRLSQLFSSVLLPPAPTKMFHDFDQYIATLPTWEQNVLSGVHLFTTPDEIVDHIRRATRPTCATQIVSDGSQQKDSMSFGWILGITDGPILAEHSGPAYGHPSSHRAEGWGMLSGARFLLHLFKYCQVIDAIEGKVATICDNAGLISRMQSRQSYSQVYPNATLAPDWDLTEQIHATYADISMSHHSFEWEKGHQDETTPHHLLSATAKYNVRADELADEYMAANPVPRLSTPLLPVTRGQLLIAGQTVESHYHYRIRSNAAEKDFQQYLQAKHQWPRSTVLDINWTTFRAASRTFESTDTHLLKLVHGKLPTRKHKSRFELHVSPQCHYCTEEETFDHLARCHNPISEQFRTNIIRNIRAYGSKHHLPAKFTTIIATAINDWLQHREPLRSAPVPASVHPCIRSQSQIGWWKFLLGFHSTSWQTFLVSVLRHTNLDDPSAIMAGLIQTAWTSLSDLWTDHLTHIHRNDQTGLYKTSIDHIDEYKTKIRLLHERREQCQAAHRDRYFHHDVEHFIATSTGHQLRSYILHYESSIYASIRANSQAQNSTLFQFPGFQRTFPAADLSPPTIPDSEDPPHHKHTRWRQALLTVVHNLSNTLRPPQP